MKEEGTTRKHHSDLQTHSEILGNECAPEGATKKQRGDPQALSEILGNGSGPFEDRIAAAEELGNLGTLAGTVGANALFSALQGDPNKQPNYNSTKEERIAGVSAVAIRLAAVKALSKLDVLTAPYVIKMIQSSEQASTYDPQIRNEVGNCIHHLGIAAVPPFLEALTNRDDSTTRLLAATWIYHSGIALLTHIDKLIKIMQANQTAEDEKMRVMIAAALGNIGRHHNTPDILDGEYGPVSRYEAARLPEPADGSKRAEQYGFVAAALIKVMQDDVSEKVQASATTALTGLPTQFIVPHASALLAVAINNDAPDETRCRSVRTLCDLGSDVNPHILQLVGMLKGNSDEECKSRRVRLTIIKALGALGSSISVVELVHTLKRIACDQDKSLAFAAAIALGSLGGGSESATILAKYVTMDAAKSNFQTAINAAEALGKLAEQDKEAVKPHVKALQDLMHTDEVHSDLQCYVADVLDNMNESY